MEKGLQYKISKIEKGPLQRFKNQNLLLKKFGETGLLIYRTISSNKTNVDLESELELSSDKIFEILSYMEEAGMVELSSKEAASNVSAPTSTSTPKSKQKEEFVVEEEFVQEKESEPIEEAKPVSKPKAAKEKKKEMFDDFITPIEEESSSKEEPEPTQESAEDTASESEEPKEDVSESVEPVEDEELKEEPVVDKKSTRKKEEPSSDFMFEETKEDTDTSLTEESSEDETLSPVERIINEKYGSVGIKVYTLIDGDRTAEEIMKETGLTDSKLIEILDFMDSQGIIKLDYPSKGKSKETAKNPFEKPATQTPAVKEDSTESGFAPILGGAEDLKNVKTDSSPIEIPTRASLDLVKEISVKARFILKFGDKGGKILEQIDGKHDVVDLALSYESGLPGVYDLLKFLLENRMIVLKPMNRDDVKKKYGDEGFAVYKRFGKEGIMLYELIGKDMSMKQIAEKVSRNKESTIDIFLFVRELLGVEVPMDRENLKRELGI